MENIDLNKIFEDFDEEEYQFGSVFQIGDKIKTDWKLDYWSPVYNENWKKFKPSSQKIINILHSSEIKSDKTHGKYPNPIMDKEDKTKEFDGLMFMLEECWCWFILDEEKLEKV